ncbi:DegT/DnrJ/EryC1/StrS family aminotransferase [Fictibacillus sp. UD]|uniref:DegT/DnrJ/EryC1/StrS family aminotransferase n=1 Tax=Fictibacillus sp. UD TaxID=3038777 RepID=UPI0037495C01
MMNHQTKRIYLSPPHIGNLEMKYVREAFQNNWIAPVGPHITLFEQELAAYTGSKGAVAISSGTAGIHLALRAIGVQAGDSVFCSSFTFVASANPILYQGASPVFIDSDPATWNMSPKALERALIEADQEGKLPKAVIVVHLYGQNADMERIGRLCTQYNVPIIEDAAESLGTTYKGHASGTYGHFGIYSFNGNKIITTSNGGMIVSDDLEALEKIRKWSTQAKEKANHYQHTEVGYNYRMSNILAGIGRGQLRVLDQRVKARRKIFETYQKELSHLDAISFMPVATYGEPTHWLSCFTIKPEHTQATPDQFINEFENHNIETRRLWKPMHLQPLYRQYLYYSHTENKSVSDELFKQGICLPSGSNLSAKDQKRIIKMINQFFSIH